MKPKEWTKDQVKTFEQDILGLHGMKENMVIRECYTQLQTTTTTAILHLHYPTLHYTNYTRLHYTTLNDTAPQIDR